MHIAVFYLRYGTNRINTKEAEKISRNKYDGESANYVSRYESKNQ